jgi:hypothetical protein
MTRKAMAALATFVLVGTNAHAESYTAISNTAMSITGDIELDETGIAFANGAKLAFSEKVGDSLLADGKPVSASVYRVENPTDPVLENGNRLCGNGDVTFIALWPDDFGMTSLAVFTGETVPESDDDMCASYSYEAAG